MSIDFIARAMAAAALGKELQEIYGQSDALIRSRLEESNRAHGGVIGTNGKGAVALTFDDSPNFIKSNMLPELTSRNFPFSLGLIADPNNPNNSNITNGMDPNNPGDLQRWSWRYGMELWSHSMTHTTPNTEADLQVEIVDSKALIEQLYGLKVAGFIQPGVTPSGLYNNLDKDKEITNFFSPAGRMLRETYAHYSAYIGSILRRIPTGSLFGASRMTVSPLPVGQTSAQHRANVIAQINLCAALKYGLALLIHPQWIDYNNTSFSNYMNLSDLQLIYDAIKTNRDNEQLEVLTLSGLEFADPYTTRRADLAAENGIGFAGISQGSPGFWSLTTVWSDKTFPAVGHWGTPSMLQDNSQSNSGTNALRGQLSNLFAFPGETFEFSCKVRSTGATAQSIRLILTAQNGAFISIQSGGSWGAIMAPTGDGMTVRLPFTMPKDTTWLRVEIGRGQGAAGSGNGLEWADIKIKRI
ncbi:Polysaccharide deacetylase [Paenibacillus algorifonticola]|uniref:Polysaccharide deacetylase n=1 Tax=Paenibacillus algorifonticola TaxID=684063 RepID=A0A1I2AJ33_9BACL|nr:polysaccharide deacetylase family protein [Paenibacillus algorifonticola]SFE43902.1 Polysaccharide deacetylase [Paenibacillus algorifonticola]